MNSCEMNASIAAIANVLAGKLSRKELAYWGVVLSHLGSTMGTLAAIEEFQSELCDKNGVGAESGSGVLEAAIGESEAAEESTLAQEELDGALLTQVIS